VFWRDALPAQRPETHKYTRGHAVVVSGPAESTGAARLGARGALRIGAGLVTVTSPRAAFPVNAAHLTAIMLKPFNVPEGLAGVLADKRRNAVLVGPGFGVGPTTCRVVEIALQSGAGVVLDADALTSFEAKEADPAESSRTSFGFLPGAAAAAPAGPERLFAAIKANAARPVVLTPHDGEFRRLFGTPSGSRLERARHAAAESGAVIVLKGADTCIAAPDGRAAINENAPPWLATAGSGDVLAGFVAGLLAQSVPAFEAAAAAVWLHGACGSAAGQGLIAEDLPEALTNVITHIF
jgi:NAD(P)H-hydrate epimerase